MKKIWLSYEDGYLFNAYIIRYFRFKNNSYFIYTLQEKDERNYMKLYVVKVMKELGVPVAQTIRNTNEWNSMKGIIKLILSEIKKGKICSIKDLDCSELENIVIYESRSFQLAQDLVDLLITIPSAITGSVAVPPVQDHQTIATSEKRDVEEVLEKDVSTNSESESEIEVLEL